MEMDYSTCASTSGAASKLQCCARNAVSDGATLAFVSSSSSLNIDHCFLMSGKK